MKLMYDIVFTGKASNFIGELKLGYRKRLKEILLQMKKNPFSFPYRKIRGENNLYRVRLGQYRILYQVNEYEKRVVILKIETRSRGYR